MIKLDRTEQRIVGVLIEKQLAVPDSYPLSENALVDGCNQKSNRDPVMELVAFQVSGALMGLQEKGYTARVEGGGRVPRFKHRVVEELQLDPKELAVLAELLLRGPQAPGALKPRVARMGCQAPPEEIESILEKLSQRSPPLVVRRPPSRHERDPRWQHLLGDGSELTEPSAPPPEAGARPETSARQPGLEDRVAAVEISLARLQQMIAELEARIGRSQAAP
ncbi:MAG TPA: DUF480 domain-containing protein [Planctomycetota bacterium]|nr:DUF480 domain-containing protein [Planctomycetota bacterium]